MSFWYNYHHQRYIFYDKGGGLGLFKVDLEFSFSIPGLFQTWNSSKPGFKKLNSRFEPGIEKLNSRAELELSKKAIIK